ncbi:MAG: D-alanyl-D-alanine carboxypeptidase [Lachnospiraceae bacterium]|nr:D-alanyl-D-alanine carboxypeptidase [Lachnospiraceae bacterium]
MKYINKIGALILIIGCLFLSACGVVEVTDKFDYSRISASGNPSNDYIDTKISFLSDGLCVTDSNDIDNPDINPVYIEAAGVFNLSTKEVVYAHHLFDKNYPASTTKIMTAYLALKYGNLDDYVTVSKEACDLPSGASTAGLTPGDVISVRDLLYGLILVSGNDSAICLAEYISGSVEAFSDLTNEELNNIYATSTHFVNPNGIHADNHYTSCYDLYLIFNEALKNPVFLDLINSVKYEATVTHKNGEEGVLKYKTTNKFLSNEASYPASYSIVGGKTGTTFDAGKCLVLLTINGKGEQVIFITLGADSKERLYDFMEEMMRGVEAK